MAYDPVCKMEVDQNNPPGGTAMYKGETYYFCAQQCRQRFESEPDKYAGKAA